MDSFTFILDSKSSEPLYMQLYSHIRGELLGGRIRAGEKLPSKRSISASLSISVNTVESAYEQLEAEGYISAKARSGFYACRLVPDFSASTPKANKRKESAAKKENYKYSFDTSNTDVHFFPYSTWSRLSKNLTMSHREFLELGNSNGDLALRETLALLLYKSRGVVCSASNIIVGAGSEYLLSMLGTLLGREKTAAIENPGYQKTYNILKNTFSAVTPVPLDSNGISVEALEKSGADIVHITPSHQFPMGIIMPVGRRISLLEWAHRKNAYIIEDDYDSEFRYAGRPVPALQGLDKHERVIYLTTFSKSISPSFRLSVMVLPRHLAQRCNEVFDGYCSTVSRYEQNTLESFISGGHFERHLNKMRKIYKQRRDCLEKQLKAAGGSNVQIIGDASGLHFVVSVNGKSEKELVESAAAVGIKVSGLSSCRFGGEKPFEDGAVLMGYAAIEEEEIERCAALLGKAWFS